MSSDTAYESDCESDRESSGREWLFAQFEALFEAKTLEQLSLECALQTLPKHPTLLSPIQIQLTKFLTQRAGGVAVSLEGYSEAVTSYYTVEELNDLTRDKAKDIVKGSQSVIDWLFHILDHLHETIEKIQADVGELDHRIHGAIHGIRTPLASWNAPKGTFVYKSIPRNLSWKQKVNPKLIPEHLDSFLHKAYAVRSSVEDPKFKTLLDSLGSFKSTTDEAENDKALKAVFKELKAYLKTILPDTTSNALAHLEKIEGRELMYDPTAYIADHRFYAYVPTDAEGAVATVTSGIVRIDQEANLNQELTYLRPKEALDILEVIRGHLHDFNDADKFKVASTHLRQLQTELFEKYSKAKRQRKDHVDPKPYVMLMNIAGGLLYGMHVKALNKSVSVMTAALRYVSKSVSAFEKERAEYNSAKET